MRSCKICRFVVLFSGITSENDKKDQLTGHASAKNEATGEFTMTVYFRGETPMMTLTNDLTGETGTYYNGNYERDYEWVELVYAEAISDLEHEYNGAYRYFQTITYTNDANGRPITADVTTDNSSNGYQSKVITYHYTDLYFYNAEG